jgi:Domain of unknown function (DUF4394)
VSSRRLFGRSALLASALALAAAASAQAQGNGDGLRPDPRVAYATTDDGQLIGFNARKPDRLFSVRNISGLPPGVKLVGVDFRPRTGDLYGVGSDSVVYRVNPRTAIAVAENIGGTPPAPVPFAPGLSGMSFGVDFNPVPDAIRLVSDAGQNQRVAPDAGTTLGVDANLNPGMPRVAGAAYTNSTFSAVQPTATQLFVIDHGQDMVYLQNPPNNGTLTMGQKLSGVDVQPQFGWDIAGSRNLGYLATRGPRARDGAALYTVDPTTGRSRLVGQIGGNRLSRGLVVTGLAVDQSAQN